MDNSIIDNPRLIAPLNSVNIVIPNKKRLVAEFKSITAKPYFFMVGNGKRNNLLGRKAKAMDLITEMAHMTPQELYLVEDMRNNLIMNEATKEDGSNFEFPTNIALITGSTRTSAEKQKIKAGYKRLNSKDIVRRVKREHYMFNPVFIIPYDYDDSILIWNSIT